jgi:beta-galactosidase
MILRFKISFNLFEFTMCFKVKIFLILLLLSNPLFCAEEILAPYRDSINVKSGWKFNIDPGSAYLEQTPSVIDLKFDDKNWFEVEVPHTINMKSGFENYSGICWYRKKFSLPVNWNDGFIYLEFLGSYLITDVWLNGNYLGRHNGGYTSFKFEITQFIDKNSVNNLVVRCDSTKRDDQAPGSVFIWFPYSGLIREVFLIKYPSVFPESVLIDTTYNLKSSKVTTNINWKLKPEFIGKTFKIKQQISFGNESNLANLDYSLTPDSTSYVSKQFIDIDSPHPWSPEHPDLYTMSLDFKSDSTRYERSDKFGIREISTSGKKILLNGKEIKLLGVALFEDSKDLGPFFDPSVRIKELEYVKSLGANMIRLGHYPHHPEMLFLCDKIGLIVYEEIPVWQYHIPSSKLDEYIDIWAKPQLEEMIKRDYNHPSLCFIGVANEIRDDINYLEKMLPYAKKLNPKRLVTYASDSSGEDREAFKYVDVISKNFHFGWFHSESPYDVKKAISNLSSIKENKPIFITEVGAMSIPDFNTSYSSDIRFSEEYHTKVLSVSLNNLISNFDVLSGLCVWTLYDFRGQGVIASSGLYDYNKKPRVYSTQVKNIFNSKPSILIIDTGSQYYPDGLLNLVIKIYSYDIKIDLESKIYFRVLDSKSVWESNCIDLKEFDWKDNTGTYEFSLKIPEAISGFNILEMQLLDLQKEKAACNYYYFDVGTEYIPAILKLQIIDNNNTPINDVKINIDNRIDLKTDFWGWCSILYYGKSTLIKASKKGYKGEEVSINMNCGKTTYQTITMSR